MNLDVAVFLWGALATVIVAAGIATGELQDKVSDARAAMRDDAE